MATRDIKAEIADRLDTLVDELYDLILEAASEAVQDSLGSARAASRGGRTTKKRSTKKRAGKKRATKKRSTKKRAGKKRSTKKRSTKKAAGKRATKKRGRRARRTSADVESVSKDIVAQLKQTPGVGIGELASAMNADVTDLKRPIAVLLEDSAIRKTGEKRGTKYFAKGR